MQELCCLTCLCHVNRPLALNVPSLHINIPKTLVTCCSVFSMVNWHSSENTKSAWKNILKSLFKSLFKKYVPLGAIDKFINLTGLRLFLLSTKKMRYVIGNPLETITGTSLLSVGEYWPSMSKHLFLTDFYDCFVGLLDAMYQTPFIEKWDIFYSKDKNIFHNFNILRRFYFTIFLNLSLSPAYLLQLLTYY